MGLVTSAGKLQIANLDLLRSSDCQLLRRSTPVKQSPGLSEGDKCHESAPQKQAGVCLVIILGRDLLFSCAPELRLRGNRLHIFSPSLGRAGGWLSKS